MRFRFHFLNFVLMHRKELRHWNDNIMHNNNL